jgi:hypothetical protein
LAAINPAEALIVRRFARTVRDIDPSIPVAHLREMDEVFTESIQRPRLLAQLMATFSPDRFAAVGIAPTDATTLDQ